jgi:hypothetical protein
VRRHKARHTKIRYIDLSNWVGRSRWIGHSVNCVCSCTRVGHHIRRVVRAQVLDGSLGRHTRATLVADVEC